MGGSRDADDGRGADARLGVSGRLSVGCASLRESSIADANLLRPSGHGFEPDEVVGAGLGSEVFSHAVSPDAFSRPLGRHRHWINTWGKCVTEISVTVDGQPSAMGAAKLSPGLVAFVDLATRRLISTIISWGSAG